MYTHMQCTQREHTVETNMPDAYTALTVIITFKILHYTFSDLASLCLPYLI